MDKQEKKSQSDYLLSVVRSPKTGTVVAQFISPASNPDIFYSPTSPAVCRWDENGRLIDSMWCNSKGEMHRDGDFPAEMRRCAETGKDVYLAYMSHNNYHRDNGKPAVICIHPDTDVVYMEQYWIHGECSLVIERDPLSGSIIYSGSPRADDLYVDVEDDSKFENTELPRVQKPKSPTMF